MSDYQPRHAGPQPTVVDHFLNAAKALVSYIAGLAIIIVGLPDVTPFLGERERHIWQVVVAVAGTIAVWWTRNKPLP